MAKNSESVKLKPLIVAHRGASFLAPECTLPAFDLAMRLGACGIELDVQRSRDGELIVFHDANLMRTTNASEISDVLAKSAVGDLSLKELRKLDAGSWFNKKFPERGKPNYEKAVIPTLVEVLDLVEKKAISHPTLFFELKSPHLYPGIEEQLVTLLKQRGWLKADGSVNSSLPSIALSFDPGSLRKLAILAPHLPRTCLLSNLREDATFKTAEELVPQLDEAQHEGHAYIGLHFTAARDPQFQKKVQERGLKLSVWTINDLHLAREMAPYVHIIVTDMIHQFGDFSQPL